jgi:hypothetical protein
MRSLRSRAQVDRRHAEVAAAELALDDVQGHALAAELDHVRVTQLVRQGAPAHTGPTDAAPQRKPAADGGQARPHMSRKSTEQWFPRRTPCGRVGHGDGAPLSGPSRDDRSLLREPPASSRQQPLPRIDRVGGGPASRAGPPARTHFHEQARSRSAAMRRFGALLHSRVDAVVAAGGSAEARSGRHTRAPCRSAKPRRCIGVHARWRAPVGGNGSPARPSCHDADRAVVRGMHIVAANLLTRAPHFLRRQRSSAFAAPDDDDRACAMLDKQRQGRSPSKPQ